MAEDHMLMCTMEKRTKQTEVMGSAASIPRGGLTEKETFKQIPKGAEEMSQEDVWGKVSKRKQLGHCLFRAMTGMFNGLLSLEKRGWRE